MLELRLGIQLESLRQPLRKAIDTAARLGAQAVEINARREINPKEMTRTAIRELRKYLDDRDLRVCALHYPTRRGFNELDDLDRRVDATKRAMSLAYELRAGIVINQIGRIPEDREDAQWSNLVQSLTEIGRHGQHCGALLAARTGVAEPSALDELIEALPPGSLGVDFDPAALILHRHSPTDAIEKLGVHVLHVHARDGVQDQSQGHGLEVQLGRGSVDFLKILAELEKHDYRGFFTLERQESRDPVVELAQGVEFMKNLWQ